MCLPVVYQPELRVKQKTRGKEWEADENVPGSQDGYQEQVGGVTRKTCGPSSEHLQMARLELKTVYSVTSISVEYERAYRLNHRDEPPADLD